MSDDQQKFSSSSPTRVYYNPNIRKVRLHEELKDEDPTEVIPDNSEVFEYLLVSGIISPEDSVDVDSLNKLIRKDTIKNVYYTVIDGIRLEFLPKNKEKIKKCNVFKEISKEDKAYLKWALWFSIITNIVGYIILNFFLTKPLSYYIILGISYFSPGLARVLAEIFHIAI